MTAATLRAYRRMMVATALTGAMLAFTACSRDEIAAPETLAVGELTVDASTAWAYVDLSTGTPVAQTAAKTSTTWDIGLNATSVVLNGGAEGPAGVSAYCVCQNAAATNDQILAMTPESQAAAFAAVTAASVPSAATAWSSDAFGTSRWYRYDILGDHRISPTFDVYLVRRGSAVHKVQLIGYYGPAGETRRISLRYAQLRS